MPLISVIIPTYNRAELLDRAIASVLRQDGNDYEVVISDNSSTDQTRSVVEKYLGDRRIRYWRNDRNIGMVGNWKNAIRELASGDWFVLLSDDDFLLDDEFLAQAAAAIRAHEPVFVYGGGEVHDVIKGKTVQLMLPFKGLVPGVEVFASRGTVKPQDIILCSMVFRRADVDRLGFFDEPDNMSCDSEFYLKLCVEGDVYALDCQASVYVKHGANLIYKINRIRGLRDKTLNHLIKPYQYARDRGVPAETLRRFRENARVDKSIANTLLLLKLHNGRWYRVCRSRIMTIVPEVVSAVERSLDYRFKSFLVCVGRPFLRRLFPMTEAAEQI